MAANTQRNYLTYLNKAGALLRSAWESGDEFSPWAAIFWLDTPAGDSADPADRVAACDAVLKAYPLFVPGHDRRADVPTVGLNTIHNLHSHGGRCLALAAGDVIMIDKPQMLALADE